MNVKGTQTKVTRTIFSKIVSVVINCQKLPILSKVVKNRHKFSTICYQKLLSKIVLKNFQQKLSSNIARGTTDPGY